MNSRTRGKYNSYEETDDLSVYGSTCSLNSSVYDSTVTDGRDNDSPLFTPLPSPVLDRFSRQSSLVDSLLAEIYSSRTRRGSQRRLTEDVDLTDCLPESSSVIGDGTSSGCQTGDCSYLEQLNVVELRALAKRWAVRVREASTQLLTVLKQREKLRNQVHRNCRVVTTVLKSWLGRKQSRRAEVHQVESSENCLADIKFRLSPKYDQNSFCRWTNAVRVMTRHPVGIPDMLRPNIWLSLAGYGLQDVDWQDVMRFAFSEHSNPDDGDLGIQIVKDLHRTGYSGYSGGDDNASRLSLKCVLLAYARWNKDVGYCQGFNVMVALLLQVMDGREEDALKVMIYIIDRVMPPHYFSRNLHSLLADIEIFHGLMQSCLPKLYFHLSQLRRQEDGVSDAKESSCEPPLVNVFTIQWFLTMFAVCLPLDCVLRLWDLILLEGSEVILCAGLCIWKLLSPRLTSLKSADEFYCTMEEISRGMQEGTVFKLTDLLKEMHRMPLLSNVKELREKYTYNISPFCSISSSMPSGDGELSSVGCLDSLRPRLSQWTFPTRKLKLSSSSKSDQQSQTGASGSCSLKENLQSISVVGLQKRYKEVRQRHQQAMVLVDVERQHSVRKPLLESKSISAATVKRNDEVEETSKVGTEMTLVGLNLVHPSIVKPLPRHKEQPVGHRTPMRSNLHGRLQKPVNPQSLPLKLPEERRNSLRLNMDLVSVSGESGNCRPINHLIDFLPHNRPVCRKHNDEQFKKHSSTWVSSTQARELQNEGVGSIPSILSMRDAYATYRRRMGTQFLPFRGKARCVASADPVLLASSAEGSLMSPRSDRGGLMLPLKQRTGMTKGSSKAIVHAVTSGETCVNGTTENHHQRENTVANLDNRVCSRQRGDARDDSSLCSASYQSVQTSGGDNMIRQGGATLSVKAERRPSLPIDLLVTTVEEDTAAKRQAEALLLSARPDLLITVASSHIS